MSWSCFKVQKIRRGLWEPCEGGGRKQELFYTLPDGREVSFKDLSVGAMFHTSDMPPYDDGSAYHAARPSIIVLLPGRVLWHMNDKGSEGCLWQIDGEIPNVTASPSINYVGIYHGWVQNGVVSDDVEGRKFDEMGWPIK